MSEGAQPATIRTLWRRTLPVWAALLLLLGITLFVAYLPLGAFNTPIALAIAAIKAALVAFFFMELARSSGLIRLAAIAGLFWLVIMFALTLSDVLDRLG
jgi:cytochrome c oxidase subunit 4